MTRCMIRQWCRTDEGVIAMQVDALLLADSAEVVNGKLYLMGGGWTNCTPPPDVDYPYDRLTASAVTIRVGYQETNEEHKFSLEFRDSDERPLGARIDGEFTVGRGADLTPGMSQLVQFAGAVPVHLPGPGAYTVVLMLDEREERRIQFQAMPKPPQSGP